MREEVLAHFPHHLENSWCNAKIEYHAEYSGFILGPGSGDNTWDKCLTKMISRATSLGREATGMQFAIRIYNMHVLPTIIFVAQLKPLPADYEDKLS